MNRITRTSFIIKKVVLFLFLLLSLSFSINGRLPQIPNHNPIQALTSLVNRHFPKLQRHIQFQVIPFAANGNDAFEVEQIQDKIVFRGSSAPALGSALSWYFKIYLNIQISWNFPKNGFKLPSILPPVSHVLRLERQTPYVFYQNPVTSSYSMWNWDWNDWEKHIDWMVLNGVNMPLAFTGQEKVWQNVFANYFNISREGINRFFTGPAYLSWNRMGNLKGIKNNILSQHFIDNQHQLQLEILTRMREYGMIIVFPGFNGFLPDEFLQHFPHSSFTKSNPWKNFQEPYSSVYSLEPSDSLYSSISTKLIEEQKKLYGFTSSLYQIDFYNEIKPKSSDLNYLKKASNSVYNAIQRADSNGVWMMQSWMFLDTNYWTLERIEAYLSGVPNDSMIILDLFSEALPIWKKTKNYFGKSWIYCVLHNFGGNLGIRGDLPTISSNPIDSFHSSSNKMLGIGLTMEGINQNYVIYDLTLEMSWRKSKIDLMLWLSSYADRRYNGRNEETRNTWKILGMSAYNCTLCSDRIPQTLIELRPPISLFTKISSSNISLSNQTINSFTSLFPNTLSSHYDRNGVYVAWIHLLNAKEYFSNQEAYQYDIVDLTRQVLGDLFTVQFKKLVYAYSLKKDIRSLCNQLMEIISDMDLILSSNKQFLLGKWISSSRALGVTEEEMNFFEYQARNQITRWGEDNNNSLNDYASKLWGGLVKSYYKERWKLFLNALESKVTLWNSTNQLIQDFELQWQTGKEIYSSEPRGNSIQIALQIQQKYFMKHP